jgi:hypothetical protein
MRICTSPGDPGYATWQKAVPISIKIFFNGTEIKDVLMADEEKRTIERYLTNEKGEYYSKDGKTVASETLYGDVHIEADFPKLWEFDVPQCNEFPKAGKVYLPRAQITISWPGPNYPYDMFDFTESCLIGKPVDLFPYMKDGVVGIKSGQGDQGKSPNEDQKN